MLFSCGTGKIQTLNVPKIGKTPFLSKQEKIRMINNK